MEKQVAVKEYMGTGKIAQIFNVAPRTVAKWIDTGLLSGTRIPGSKHRRVSLSEITRFAKEWDLPMLGVPQQPPQPEVKEEEANEVL